MNPASAPKNTPASTPTPAAIASHPAQFGLSSAQASQLGLTISSALTPAFWIYCMFVIALMISCAWMLFSPDQAPGPVAGRFAAGAGQGSGAGTDTEVEQWHVARSGSFGPDAKPGTPDGESDGGHLDDDDFDREGFLREDEFDSYEEFGSDEPSGRAARPDAGPA